eukprot:COSAG01_NODE_8903_length_2621_cov_1.653450_6_plen_42_part_01
MQLRGGHAYAAIGGLDPGVTRKWLAGRLAGCCLLIDRLHGLN